MISHVVQWLGFGALTAVARIRFPAWELYHFWRISFYLLRGLTSHQGFVEILTPWHHGRREKVQFIFFSWIRYRFSYMTFNSWKSHNATRNQNKIFWCNYKGCLQIGNFCRSFSNGDRTEWSPIRSVIIRVITKSGDRAAGVRFVHHEYSYRLNWTTRSPIIN